VEQKTGDGDVKKPGRRCDTSVRVSSKKFLRCDYNCSYYA